MQINPIFKYGGLRDLILSKPRSNRPEIRQKLCRELDIHENTLSNWMAIKFNSNSEIKELHLKKIAKFFNVNVYQLKSHPVSAPTQVSK